MSSEQICDSVNFLRIVLCVNKKFSTTCTIEFETHLITRVVVKFKQFNNFISYVIQSNLLCGNGNITHELTEFETI